MRPSTVDFLRDPQQPFVGWILLAFGVIGLGVSIWFQQQWATERSEALHSQQLTLAANSAKPQPVRPTKPSPTEWRLQQAQAELQRPWLPVLRAVESATAAPIYLLSLNIDPSTGLVKLEAEAPSFDHALSFVSMLDAGGALQPAVLVSHAETASAQADKPWVRFSVATQWSVR